MAGYFRFVLDHELDYCEVDGRAVEAMGDYCDALRSCDFGMVRNIESAANLHDGSLDGGCYDGVLLASMLCDLATPSGVQLFVLDERSPSPCAPRGAGGSVVAQLKDS